MGTTQPAASTNGSTNVPNIWSATALRSLGWTRFLATPSMLSQTCSHKVLPLVQQRRLISAQKIFASVQHNLMA